MPTPMPIFAAEDKPEDDDRDVGDLVGATVGAAVGDRLAVVTVEAVTVTPICAESTDVNEEDWAAVVTALERVLYWALYAVTVYPTSTLLLEAVDEDEWSEYDVMLTLLGDDMVLVESAAQTEDLKAEEKLL